MATDNVKADNVKADNVKADNVKAATEDVKAATEDVKAATVKAATEDVKAEAVDVAYMFPTVVNDLSKVTWAHAANSKKDLEKYIADDSIMMLEADILPGHLAGEDTSEPTIPIMAHPPDVVSDISFEMWIDVVIKANQEEKSKGAKLDFKDLNVVKDCLEILKSRSKQITFPLWLNADILKGPGGDTREPVSADKFLTSCVEAFPQATLSVGWTTKYPSADDKPASYTRKMIEEMSKTVDARNVAQPVTFPVRAAFVPGSIENLDWLLDSVPDSTISVWSSSSDTVDIPALITLRDTIGHDSVYYDLPEGQKKEFEDAKDSEVGSASHTYHLFPTNASAWATVGIALASALAALYLYD